MQKVKEEAAKVQKQAKEQEKQMTKKIDVLTKSKNDLLVRSCFIL